MNIFVNIFNTLTHPPTPTHPHIHTHDNLPSTLYAQQRLATSRTSGTHYNSPYLAAEVGFGTLAKFAVSTLRDVQRDHMITWQPHTGRGGGIRGVRGGL